MRKYILYKDADIVVGKQSLRIHTISYPLDDILYAEVHDNSGAVRTEAITPCDLFDMPLLPVTLLSISFVAMFIFAIFMSIHLTTSLASIDFSSYFYFMLLLLLVIPQSTINRIMKPLFARGTSYSVSIYFREESLEACSSSSLFYAQVIARRINRTVKKRLLLIEQLSANTQH